MGADCKRATVYTAPCFHSSIKLLKNYCFSFAPTKEEYIKKESRLACLGAQLEGYALESSSGAATERRMGFKGAGRVMVGGNSLPKDFTAKKGHALGYQREFLKIPSGLRVEFQRYRGGWRAHQYDPQLLLSPFYLVL